MPKRVRWLMLLLLTLVGSVPAEVGQTGVLGLAHRFKRLDTTVRVLHLGAHPDDEDSALLTKLSLGDGMRVAYLSLNRGEGGQNAIGSELGDALGILRTSELLAARSIDGTEQYFTTAIDFGFSKTSAETLRFWGHDRMLGEVVALVRRFRPQVLVSRFAGTPSDGHGHHQAAGILAREAYDAAGDPNRFPEQLKAGLQPWQPLKFYLGGRPDLDGRLNVEVGEYSPLYGRTYDALAMEGRSRHRSQDMGRIQPNGPDYSKLLLVHTRVPCLPFEALDAGLDTKPANAVPAPVAEGPEWQAKAHQACREAAAAVLVAEGVYPLGLYPRNTTAHLAAALKAYRRAATILDDQPWTPETATWKLAVTQKVHEASEALALAAGLRVDALCDRSPAAPGTDLTVSLQGFWPLTAEVEQARLELDAPDGWPVQRLTNVDLLGNTTPDALAGFRVTIPPGAPPSQPSWLRLGAADHHHRVEPLSAAIQPFAPAPLTAELRALVAGTPVSLRAPVVHRWADPRRGEQRRELQVLPRVSASLRPALLLAVKGAGTPLVTTATIRNQTNQALHGRLELRDGGQIVASQPLELPGGAERALRVELPAKLAVADRTLDLRAVLVEGDQATPLTELHQLQYDHVPTHLYLPPAEVKVAPVELQTTDRRIGYVPGPGDYAAEALVAMGLHPTILEADELAAGQFDRFDTILVGVRAYEVNEPLQQANEMLRAWVKRGGVLVVLYQKYPYLSGDYELLPLTFVRPHDRVTDETASVTMLQPNHPLLTTPNQLGPSDFAGWVQERGLYFAHTWDDGLTPLLSCHDPGDSAKDGGWLVGQVGDGAFVYCAYALFRQLPAGVPGAYRILANLVAYRP